MVLDSQPGSVLGAEGGALDGRRRLWRVLGVRLGERGHRTPDGGPLAVQAGLLEDKPAAGQPQEHVEEAQDLPCREQGQRQLLPTQTDSLMELLE